MFGNILGAAAAGPIEAIGNVFDKLFTSDEEKLDKKNAMLRLMQKGTLAQVELNKVEAQHRNIFVAGWRPAIGWVCAFGLGYEFIVQPLLETMGYPAPRIEIGELKALVFAMLGMGTLRTAEKFGGRAK